jgi:hypothetical protein
MAKQTQKTQPQREHQEIAPSDVGPMPTQLMPIAKPPALVNCQQNEMARAFLDEAKGPRETPTCIPIISIDHKGGLFVLPSGECTEIVEGFPVLYFQTRRFYEKPPQAGQKGTPPDCWSADNIVPHGDSTKKQADACVACPKNVFGTGRDGRSKACGTFTWVFLLNPNFGTPPIGVLVAPPSSIRPLMGNRFSPGYFARCAAKHGVYEIVWSRFRLEKQGDTVQYCTLAPEMGGVPDNIEEVRQLSRMRNEFSRMMQAMRGATPNVSADSE